jgi:dTDP-4-amino-4,6-dideoxygalactose transaminase
MEPYQELEQSFAQWLGVDSTRCVACSSGTAALHLALESLPIQQRSVVAVPDYTMVACARAATLAGMIPTFVDCGDDLLMDTRQLPNDPRVTCGMAVHVYGRRCDMVGVHRWAQRNYAMVIEDMAEIHGVPPHPDTHAACWSFYENKIVGGEEGGMVMFKHARWADKARQLRTMGFTSRHDFDHVPRGHNYRLANCLAELVLESLHDFPDNFADRRMVEDWYDERAPQEWRMPRRDAPWVYDLRVPGLKRERMYWVVKRLNGLGIDARMGFLPMTRQQEYRSETGPGAARAADEVLYLPIRPDLAEADCEAAVEALVAAVEEYTPVGGTKE